MGGLFPSVSLSEPISVPSKAENVFSIPGMPSNPDGIEVGQDNTFHRVVFRLRCPLIAPQLWATLQLSEIELEMESQGVCPFVEAVDCTIRLTKAYYGAILLRISYKCNQTKVTKTIEKRQNHYNKYKQGTVSEFEWIRPMYRHANAMTNLVVSENAVNLSKLQLKMLMGIDMNTEIETGRKLSDFEQNHVW